jgi:hypothetical protein
LKGLKTQTLKVQNDKFIKAIKEYEVEYSTLDQEKIEINENKEHLEKEYENLHRKFV